MKKSKKKKKMGQPTDQFTDPPVRSKTGQVTIFGPFIDSGSV